MCCRPRVAAVPGVRVRQLLALLISSCEHNGVVKGLRAAERDVGLQGVDEARGVHLDELHLGQVRVAARQGEEFVGVVLDRSDAAEQHDLPDRAVRHRRPEALLHEVGEAAPRWHTDGELEPTPVRCMAAYQTRRGSGVPCPRKKVSHRFSHGSGSSLSSKVGNSRRTRGWKWASS